MQKCSRGVTTNTSSIPNTTLSIPPASFKRVITSIITYGAVYVDQKQTRAVHNCPHCFALCSEEVTQGKMCHAIHYGFCTVVALPPGIFDQDKCNNYAEQRCWKFFRDQRESHSPAQKIHVPPFYFPMGRPVPSEENEAVIQRVTQLFESLPEERAYKHQMDKVAMACKCPQYWKMPLFLAAGGDKVGYVTSHMYLTMWKRLIRDCHDDAARFFRLLAKPGCSYLVPEDFYPFIQEVVDSHPGLTFLLDAPEFHSRYIHTVIARIFYCVNRTWNGRITLPELRKSNLLSVIALLEEEDDINQILDYFSYEHFYVIYCKFWELDTDHDLFIDKKDLSRHNDHVWYEC